VQAKPFSELKATIETIIADVINEKLAKHEYDAREAQRWTNEVSEEIIKRAQDQSKLFKYSCTVLILQKGESGFHMSASCYWDSKDDGNVNKKFEYETFYCIVSFFGISRN
jgi:dynein light chain Tctex-type 1